MIDRILYRRKPAGLGWAPPTDRTHETTYKMNAATPVDVPVVLGISWYTAFDKPVSESGRYWIGPSAKALGYVRGGHCVCLKPGGITDPLSWWTFYNQGDEGACVGFGTSRAASLLHRREFNAWWMWDQAKLADGWPETNPGDGEGTSVHAGLSALKKLGHVAWARNQKALTYKQRDALPPSKQFGISGYRWTSSADDVIAALQSPLGEELGAVALLNSWGRGFPRVTFMPGETLQRLLDEGGEAGILIR